MYISPGTQVLITGAAGGIGRALALEFARRGAELWLVDINEQGLRSVCSEIEAIGSTAIARPCDLADSSEIAECVNEIRARWGGLDVLVNNAGVCYYGATELMSAEQWQKVLAINLLAPIELIRLCDPLMRRRPQSHIVNVCSFFGLVPYYKNAAYQASKFGLVGLSQSLRLEYAGTGRDVTAVCPGFVTDTKLFEAMELPRGSREKMPRPPWVNCKPETVALATVRAVERNRGMVVITPLAKVWWYGMRFAPWLMDWIIRTARKRHLRRAQAKVHVAPAAYATVQTNDARE